MEIKGKIKFIGQMQGGTSAKGTQWQKVDFVVEELKDYPNSAVITAFGERVNDMAQFAVGSEVKVTFDIQSREYNGRWFNNVNMYRIENLVQQQPAQQPQNQYIGAPQGQFVPQPPIRPQQPQAQPINFGSQKDDGLPF